jgi:DNA polymerase-3 subunit epsilon
MSWSLGGGGCFPTGRHYPGIAHLIRISQEGLADEWEPQSLVRDIPWVSIDTETTGRDAAQDRVIEVGCVLFVGGRVSARHGWLINPGCPIPEDATRVHGIKNEDVADKPAFSEVAAAIVEVLSGHLPLAYNAEFDRAFLRHEYARLDERFDAPALRDETIWLDPLDWARELHKEHKSRALGEVCERLGISLENAHRAT